MADIAEQICLAVDTIVSERLKSINYNSTIIATVIDDTNSNNNSYICTDGSSNFVAYGSNQKYKKDDSVQVLIPNNDYSQQKIIIGRFVEKDKKPFLYSNPLSKIVDISGNLIIGNKEIIAKSLLANSPFCEEKHLWTSSFNGYNNFTRLGIKGSFRSWLNNLNTISGTYGYRLEIFSDNGNTVSFEIDNSKRNKLIKNWISIYESYLMNESFNLNFIQITYKDTPEDWCISALNKINDQKLNTKEDFLNYLQDSSLSKENKADLIKIMLSSIIQISCLYFNEKDMIGDPYNFQTFFDQEGTFDISSIGTIYGMSLYFYQAGNFFDSNNNKIPHVDEFNSELLDNLFTKEPYICLGYDIDSFKNEDVILYTLDNQTYKIKDSIPLEENKKTIKLRWLHKFEDGKIKVVNKNHKINYSINWYRYSFGSPSPDEYSGVYWEKILADKDDPFNCTFIPSAEVKTEQIKAIIITDQKEVLTSNIITFQNEKDVPSSATIDALSGLSIHCKDGSFGNYCVYGQNNNLLNSNDTNERLELEAHFGSIQKTDTIITDVLDNATKIVWTFPLNNTMLIVDGFNYNKKPNEEYALPGFYDENTEIKVIDNLIKITRTGLNVSPKQKYRIKRTYNSSNTNNTVTCSIIKDSLIYSTSKDFTFGIMGTNGTDATIVIDFDDNKTALTASENNESLRLTVRLYDQSHKEIDFNNSEYSEKKIKIKWEWKDYFCPEKNYPVILETHAIDDEDKSSNNRKTDLNSENKIPRNQCYISHDSSISMNCFFIVKVIITGFGNYPLESYFSIPIRSNKTFRYILGPSEIVYNSSGYANYFKQPYQLWGCSKSEAIDTENDLVKDGFSLTMIDSSWRVYNPYAENPNFVGTVENNILKPISMYFKGSKPYGVQCYLNTSAKDLVWTQPLVILQNQYPSTTINKWDGKTVQINKDEGFIISPAIAAGKKNADNTFNGVMIGDWSNTDTAGDVSNQTGVYGFHEGKMVYAFKDNGTAFIGKNGKGRIIFEGNKGEIKSSTWTENKKVGMFLDLNDGVLKMQKEPGYDQVFLTEETYEKGKYYILYQNWNLVPLDKEYDDSVNYYINGIVYGYNVTENNFDPLENKYYVKSDPNFIQCKSTDSFDDSIQYFILGYKQISIKQEEYIKNKYYIKIDNNYIKASEDFKPDQVYYIQEYKKAVYLKEEYQSIEISSVEDYDLQKKYYKKLYYESNGQYIISEIYTPGITYFIFIQDYYPITKEQFDQNKTLYFIKEKEHFVQVTPEEKFDRHKEYYIEGYNLQNYDIQKPDLNWNTLKDPIIKKGKHYYTLSEAYIKSNGEFSNGENYYEDNTGLNSRYITLSAAASRFPLAIGNYRNESSRKFRVDWDGTCYIQDGKFSGTINAKDGVLGDLDVQGTLFGGHVKGATIEAISMITDYIEANKSGTIGGWQIGNHYLFSGKTELNSINGITTNRLCINDINSANSTGSLGYVGLIKGKDGAGIDTFNIGIMSLNKSIILDTTGDAVQEWGNIAFRSNDHVFTQAHNFSVMGIGGGWNCLSTSVNFFSSQVNLGREEYQADGVTHPQIRDGNIQIVCDSLHVNCPKEKQDGIYARFA